MKPRDYFFIFITVLFAAAGSYLVVKYIKHKQEEYDRVDREYKQSWKDVHVAADSLAITYDSLIASYRRYQKVLNKVNESLDRQLKKLEKD